MIGNRFEIDGRTYVARKAKNPGVCDGCDVLTQENNGVPCRKNDEPCQHNEVLKASLVG